MSVMKLSKIDNATPQQKDKLLRAIEVVEKTIRCRAFKKEVVRRFGQEVYDTILKGTEIEEVSFYFRKDTGVAGMADADKGTIQLNSYHFDYYKEPVNGSVFFHEYLHLLGYHHKDQFDYSSVPYALGEIMKTMIKNEKYLPSRWRKIGFWLRFAGIKLIEGIFFLFSLPFFIPAFLLKHKLKINIPPFKWMLNETEDGDFGDEPWRKRNGLKDGSFKTFLLWWFRNPNWNFKLLFKPKNHANNTVFQVIKNDVGDPFHWMEQDERGTNFLYYEIDGTIYSRYSHTNKVFNIQAGSAGLRYNLKIRKSKKHA